MLKIMVIAMSLLATSALAEDKKDEMICGPSDLLENTFNEQGLHHLLDMKNEKNVTQSLWLGGQVIIVTAQKDEKTSCILTNFKEVAFNPKTITDIYNVLQKSQRGI